MIYESVDGGIGSDFWKGLDVGNIARVIWNGPTYSNVYWRIVVETVQGFSLSVNLDEEFPGEIDAWLVQQGYKLPLDEEQEVEFRLRFL